jgi:hypothetical protein
MWTLSRPLDFDNDVRGALRACSRNAVVLLEVDRPARLLREQSLLREVLSV